MTVIYHEDQADIDTLIGQTVAVIGYGAIGRPTAINMRDTGLTDIIIGDDTEMRASAEADGFRAAPIAEAAQLGDIIIVALPIEGMMPVYMTRISPNLTANNALIFISAYNVAFGFIEAPPFVDVGLVAPRTISGAPRSRFSSDGGPFASFVAVGQDATGNAWPIVLAVALAVGALSGGGVEVSLEQEAEMSLFVQQAIIPAFHNLMRTAATLLLKEGYPPEAIFQDLYIGGKFPDFMRNIAQSGMQQTLNRTTMSTQYATYSRLDRFNEIKLERLMEITLDEIRSGDFAQEWNREHSDGHRRLDRLIKQFGDSELWDLEQQTLDYLDDDLPPIYGDDDDF